MAGTITTRDSFYQRTPTSRRLVLQDRDYRILWGLAKWRFLRKAQLFRLVGGSEQMLGWRLKLLFDHKLITRPERQRALLADEPSPGGVYGLSMAGARIITHHEGWDLARFTHVGKNERVGAEFILHAVMLADALIDLHLSAATHGVTAIREQHELIEGMPAQTQRSPKPFLWRTRRVPYDTKVHDINLDPDRLVSLEVAAGRHNLVFELGRTLTIKPQAANFRRNTNAWKIAGYLHGFRDQVHVRDWGFSKVRFCFIDTTPRRVEKLCALASDLTRDSLPGLFLFTDIASVREKGVYAPIWSTHRGELVSLL